MDDIGGTVGDDAQVEAAVLRQVLLLHPTQVTLEELVREVAVDPEAFAERDAIERAVARPRPAPASCTAAASSILPSRAAQRFSELLGAG